MGERTYSLLNAGEESKQCQRHTGWRCVAVILMTLTLSGCLLYYYNLVPLTDDVSVLSGSGRIDFPPPPPYTEYARVARYIIHISDWASLATISTHPGIESYPFANVFSISDGADTVNCTGVPYIYLTPLELSAKDIRKDERASLTASLAQSDYCARHSLDPQDPRCAHVILTGVMEQVAAGSTEAEFAKNALFTRHPEMKEWPQDHDWFFVKLVPRHIYLLDYFGGAQVVPVEEYLSAHPFQTAASTPTATTAS